VESKYGAPNIGFWTNARDWVSWQFQIDRPGRFNVTAELATPAAGSKFELTVANEKLSVEVSSTSDYGKFKTVKLGAVQIGRGPQELSIKPVRNQWQPINLREIVLTPAE
jgi:hypothetical protein